MNTYTTQQFLQLEDRVWSALVSGDIKAESQLLTDDFLGVYSGGFSKKEDHIDQLKNGPIIAHYELVEARIRVLSEEVVLLSYLANYASLINGNVGESESMYVTSIWRRSSGEWKNSFSQDTSMVTNE